jgi:sortase A
MKDIAVPVPKRTLAIGSSFSGLLSQGISQITTDFTDARNWYPQVQGENTGVSVESYKISIPSLKIENAEVSTVDYELEKHLIQYAGTSIPGERGTSVILGHSTLPQFFDPKNYKTIFATLHTIKEGDKIYAEVNGKKYTYTVFSKTITSPEDTEMFSQAFDTSYITLITCTPPGTVWKRLVVRARLDAPSEQASKLPASKYGTY